MAPLGAALLGTGIFAKDIYKNNFKAKEGEVELRAVWSRTIESAQAYVQEFFPSSRALAGEEALQQILEDDSIQLVVVVLPVQAALKIVERCLAAGKAVVQEKPVAATVTEALGAIERYRRAVAEAEAQGPQRTPLWLFAENYRYEAVFVAACQRVSELGKIIKLDLIADLPMDERNRYFGSSWRRDTSGCPGGFFMDSSVHFVAALRMMAAAAGLGQAVSATAHALQAKPELSFPDSVVGVALFANGGVPASISISLAAHQVRWSLSVVGTEGSLEVSRGGWGGVRTGYTLSIKTARPQEPQQQQPGGGQADPTGQQVLPFAFSGCQDEFAEFVSLTKELRRTGTEAAGDGGGGGGVVPDAAARSSPEEGCRDLALVEALLSSAAAGGQPVRVVQI
ncbi:hypothetical protein PLESTB_001199000 [Pleodorina starrii]|uniref:Oxidoreductase n=1 Tax=Pleodorina starrii TaxID=330485 RepID=A0A9W6F5P0_9CHLO|nr:hypothetical protein PLESTM_001836600 [Pleodorina starrii]GLC57209.1 hypothetical protein PLESTB_001199000 [Pleodorina starrii]GLC71407.1 hypothetical protein PLESTF_001112600 [Pleodorina starrii]